MRNKRIDYMNKIPTICFENVYDFCETVDSEFNRHYYASKSDEAVDISIFAKYDNARKIINILTDYDYKIANVNFNDPKIDGYEDEFVITLCARLSSYDAPEIWVEPAKRKDGYLLNEANATYILDECNSALLPKAGTVQTYFVKLKEDVEDEYDDFADDLECGNCEECHIFDDSDDEENAKDDVYATVELTPEESQILDMLYHAFGLLKYVV